LPHAIRPELLQECREAFDLLDNDHSGSVDRTELKQALAGAGAAVEGDLLDDIFDQLDVDGDGLVSFPEFVSMMVGLVSPEQGIFAARLAFSAFDRNGDDRLNLSELSGALQSLGRDPRDAHRVMQQADLDGDGVLELVEFLSLLGS